ILTCVPPFATATIALRIEGEARRLEVRVTMPRRSNAGASSGVWERTGLVVSATVCHGKIATTSKISIIHFQMLAHALALWAVCCSAPYRLFENQCSALGPIPVNAP